MNIRLEQPSDYREVENLTREAFWNLYVHGCDEHYFAHILRDAPCFIPQLDFVAVINNQIVGNIMYTKAVVKSDSGNAHSVITFGPLSVLPEFQKQGVGSALIKHSKAVAAEMGFGAILIYGNPKYYHKQGFIGASKFKISNSDGAFVPPLMAMELYSGALSGIEGRFFEDSVFHVSQEAAAIFDKDFPHKEKFDTDTQKEFQRLNGLTE